MTTYTVNASANDGEQESCPSGKSPATGGVMKITTTIHQIGSHGGANSCWISGFRFVSVTETGTISAATFSLVADSTYAVPGGSTVKYIVSCHAADNAGQFVVAGNNDLLSSVRTRTTADATWTADSVTGGTRYSIDITAAVQEVLSRGGWASGNAIVVLVDDNSSSSGEWQDWRGWDAATSGDEAQLIITAGAAATSSPFSPPRIPPAILAI